MNLLTSGFYISFSLRIFYVLLMAVTLLVTSSFSFKDLMERFKTNDIGCR